MIALVTQFECEQRVFISHRACFWSNTFSIIRAANLATSISSRDCTPGSHFLNWAVTIPGYDSFYVIHFTEPPVDTNLDPFAEQPYPSLPTRMPLDTAVALTTSLQRPEMVRHNLSSSFHKIVVYAVMPKCKAIIRGARLKWLPPMFRPELNPRSHRTNMQTRSHRVRESIVSAYI